MSGGCLYTIGTVTVVLFSLFLPALNPDEPMPTTNATDLLMLDSCTAPPCLFGQSLREASYEQVETILENSPLTQEATIVHHETSLDWYWPEAVAAILAPASDYPPFYNNYVNFRQGSVDLVKLIFTIRLDELLDRWGEPDTIIPFGYTHWGDMEILLTYEASADYFGVLTSCREPELGPNNLIRYHISAAPESIPRLPSEEIPWTGYTDDLPDCSIFQP